MENIFVQLEEINEELDHIEEKMAQCEELVHKYSKSVDIYIEMLKRVQKGLSLETYIDEEGNDRFVEEVTA